MRMIEVIVGCPLRDFTFAEDSRPLCCLTAMLQSIAVDKGDDRCVSLFIQPYRRRFGHMKWSLVKLGQFIARQKV